VVTTNEGKYLKLKVFEYGICKKQSFKTTNYATISWIMTSKASVPQKVFCVLEDHKTNISHWEHTIIDKML